MNSVLASSQSYDVAALAADVATARRILDFGAGTFAHCLSLPAEDDIHPDHRAHRNNNPYADCLGVCPVFAAIFAGFRTAKAGFRLLRREAGSAYSLHDDRDVGDAIVRMQMPVVTNASALLLVQKDGAELLPIARRVDERGRDDRGPIVYDYARLAEDFGEWFDIFFLEPGHFHLIEASRVHTLVNAGEADRITLCIDMLRNDWLDDWLAANLTRAIPTLGPDRLPAGTWDWGALRHGLLSHPRVPLA